MNELNYWAIVVATVGAFLISGGWYAMLGDAMAKLQKSDADSSMPPWKILVELARSLAVVVVVAIIFSAIGVNSWIQALGYGMLLWIAFPVVYLVGSSIHENVPWKLAAIHGGDWLLKLLFIAVVVGLWH